jgi:hypothetical protein
MTRGEAFRGRAGGASGERDRFRPLQEAQLPEARLPRGRIHKRDSYCKSRTSLSQQSSNPGNVGRLEAASIPFSSSSGDIHSVRCWSSPSAASEVSCRVRVERLPYSPQARFTPGKSWFPRSHEGFGTLNWAVIPAQVLAAASLYRSLAWTSTFCAFFAHIQAIKGLTPLRRRRPESSCR